MPFQPLKLKSQEKDPNAIKYYLLNENDLELPPAVKTSYQAVSQFFEKSIRNESHPLNKLLNDCFNQIQGTEPFYIIYNSLDFNLGKAPNTNTGFTGYNWIGEALMDIFQEKKYKDVEETDPQEHSRLSKYQKLKEGAVEELKNEKGEKIENIFVPFATATEQKVTAEEEKKQSIDAEKEKTGEVPKKAQEKIQKDELIDQGQKKKTEEKPKKKVELSKEKADDIKKKGIETPKIKENQEQTNTPKLAQTLKDSNDATAQSKAAKTPNALGLKAYTITHKPQLTYYAFSDKPNTPNHIFSPKYPCDLIFRKTNNDEIHCGSIEKAWKYLNGNIENEAKKYANLVAVLIARWDQDKEFREALKATQDHFMIYEVDSQKKTDFGTFGVYRGNNLYGKALMEVKARKGLLAGITGQEAFESYYEGKHEIYSTEIGFSLAENPGQDLFNDGNFTIEQLHNASHKNQTEFKKASTITSLDQAIHQAAPQPTNQAAPPPGNQVPAQAAQANAPVNPEAILADKLPELEEQMNYLDIGIEQESNRKLNFYRKKTRIEIFTAEIPQNQQKAKITMTQAGENQVDYKAAIIAFVTINPHSKLKIHADPDDEKVRINWENALREVLKDPNYQIPSASFNDDDLNLDALRPNANPVGQNKFFSPKHGMATPPTGVNPTKPLTPGH